MHFRLVLKEIITQFMSQHLQSHSHRSNLEWNPIKLQATLRNADKTLNYILLTNSIKFNNVEESHVERICEECNSSIKDIIFSIKVGNDSNEFLSLELQDLKCTVLPFRNIHCRLEEIIGSKSALNQKKSAIITNNLVISSQKTIKEGGEIDRELYCTAASQSLRASESIDDPPLEDLSSSVVFSLQKEQEVIQNYELYVTKLQKEVGEGYRSYMFYQYAWTETQIEYIMHSVERHFGPIHTFVPKRRYLYFTFARNKYDYLFRNKFDVVNRDLFFRQQLKLEGNILNYYLMSKKQLLPYQQQTGKLFLLPNNQSIVDMLIISQWIIVAAENYVMFVHSERPMEYFHHEQKVLPTQIASYCSGKNVVLVADKRGLIYNFCLEETKVVLKAKYSVSYLIPHSIVSLDNTVGVAGIDVQSSKKVSKHSIFIVNLEGKIDKTNKSLPYLSKLQVVSIQGESKHPINNLKSTKEKDVVACTWNNKFFLISLQGFKLIEVQLKSVINKVMDVPFLFNHLNFIVLLGNGDVVRIGVESYGQGLGAELSQIKVAQIMDCILTSDESARFELYGCSGPKIDKISYLNESKQKFLGEDSGKIVKLASSNEGMAYLLDLDHSIELKYLEI